MPVYRILVADGDIEHARRLAYGLRWAACKVFVSRSGKETLGLMDSLRPHLLLLDLDLQDMEGIRLFKVIRERPHFGGLPIILMSGLASQTPLHARRR